MMDLFGYPSFVDAYFKSYPSFLTFGALGLVGVACAAVILALCICIAKKSKHGGVLAILSGIASAAFCLFTPGSASLGAGTARNSLANALVALDLMGNVKTVRGNFLSLLFSFLSDTVGFVAIVLAFVFFIFMIVKTKPKKAAVFALVTMILQRVLPVIPATVSGAILGVGAFYACSYKSMKLIILVNWITAPIDVLTSTLSMVLLTLAYAFVLLAVNKQNKIAACACAPVEEVPVNEEA